MRISTGIYRNKKILTFEDKELRPTTSMVREAIFNILSHNENFYGIYENRENLTFLEICCGSAIVSFEALSRGIKKAIALDYNPKAKEIFEQNSKNILKNHEMTKFLLADINDFPKYQIKTDICFIDPPYEKQPYYKKILTSLAKNNWLNNNAIIILESSNKIDIIDDMDNYQFLFSKKYGNSKLSFFKFLMS